MFEFVSMGRFTEQVMVFQCSTLIVIDLCYTMEIALKTFNTVQLLMSKDPARKRLYVMHHYCPLPRASSFSSFSFSDRDGIFCDFDVSEALPESRPEAPPCLLVFEDFFLACSGPGCSNSRLRGLTPWDSGCSGASPYP